jgi:shikimate kinase
LAARAGVLFTDTDALVVERTGRSIAALFADGTFREREREVVAEVLLGARGVVALGGGSVLWDGLDAALAGWGIVALHAGPAVLAQRIRDDTADRPSLTGAPADEEIEIVSASRANRYAGLADFSVATDKLDEGQVVEKILQWHRRR